MRTVDTGRAAACALERRQRDFPKADITRRPVRVPSLHARSGGGLEPFRCGSASCPMHNARRDGVRLPAPVGGGSGGGGPRSAGGEGGGLEGGLGRQPLEHGAVRISEIKPASATTAIDLHIVERAGSTAVRDALGTDAVEDAVKLRFIDLEGVVVTLELRIIVEIEGQRVVDPQRREVRERTFIAQNQDAGEEARRCYLVLRREDS